MTQIAPQPALISPADGLSPLSKQWHEALRDVVIRHPHPDGKVTLHLRDERCGRRTLTRFEMRSWWPDSTKPSSDVNMISARRSYLTFFPGLTVARSWLSIVWAGELAHEALEAVTVDGKRPLDPHEHVAPFDIGARTAPSWLTPESLRVALATMFGETVADCVINEKTLPPTPKLHGWSPSQSQ